MFCARLVFYQRRKLFHLNAMQGIVIINSFSMSFIHPFKSDLKCVAITYLQILSNEIKFGQELSGQHMQMSFVNRILKIGYKIFSFFFVHYFTCLRRGISIIHLMIS